MLFVASNIFLYNLNRNLNRISITFGCHFYLVCSYLIIIVYIDYINFCIAYSTQYVYNYIIISSRLCELSHPSVWNTMPYILLHPCNVGKISRGHNWPGHSVGQLMSHLHKLKGAHHVTNISICITRIMFEH